jgi:hypothetical protein
LPRTSWTRSFHSVGCPGTAAPLGCPSAPGLRTVQRAGICLVSLPCEAELESLGGSSCWPLAGRLPSSQSPRPPGERRGRGDGSKTCIQPRPGQAATLGGSLVMQCHRDWRRSRPVAPAAAASPSGHRDRQQDSSDIWLGPRSTPDEDELDAGPVFGCGVWRPESGIRAISAQSRWIPIPG